MESVCTYSVWVFSKLYISIQIIVGSKVVFVWTGDLIALLDSRIVSVVVCWLVRCYGCGPFWCCVGEC